MISERNFNILGLIWLLGWGSLLLRFPTQCFRVLVWGRRPTTKQLKRLRILGYMGLGFGSLALVEIAFGLVSLK